MNKFRLLKGVLRKNVPLGLSAIAVVGVVATGYFAVKAGEKCSRKKAVETLKQDISNTLKLEKKPIMETKHEWTVYAAPVIMGAGTDAYGNEKGLNKALLFFMLYLTAEFTNPIMNRCTILCF